MKREQGLSLKTLTKYSVWDISENDVFRMWKAAQRDADLKDNHQHYYKILTTAFELEEIAADKPEIAKKYRARGFKVGQLKGINDNETKWCVKKRKIVRVADLTMENIHCISAAKLLEIIDRNFGGGWNTLTPATQKIITSHFDVATTTLPKNRLHNEGGLYDKKVAEGYEVLEIPKGTWEEVIFAKEKSALEELLLQRAAALEAREDNDSDDNRAEDYFAADDEEYIDPRNDDIKENDEISEEELEEGEEDYEYGTENLELTIDDIVASEDEG